MTHDTHTISARDASSPERTQRVLPPLLLAAAGVVLLVAIATAQFYLRAQGPMPRAVLITAESPPWPGMLSVQLRRLPPHPDSLRGRVLSVLSERPAGEALITQLGMLRGPRAAFIEEVPAMFADALASGRMPQPGKPEVLAGDLAVGDTVSVPPATFEVVGRLKPGTPVLLNAYILPAHPHFQALFSGSGVEQAWFDPEGRTRLITMQMGADDERVAMRTVEMMARAHPGFATLSIVALAMMAIGGSLAQIRLLRRIARRPPLVLGRVLRDWAERPKLVYFTHFVLYGGFFVAMAAGLALPRLNFEMAEWTRYMFSEGDLDYIGAAYESGNILAAAAATFRHNYLFATILTGMLPSLVVPFWAFLINLVRFTLVGFVLAPLWTQSAAGYTYHGVTMVLELEAYIVASFAAVMFVVHLAEGLRTGAVGQGAGRALACMVTGAVLAGIMLGIAALYEAATLISFGGM